MGVSQRVFIPSRASKYMLESKHKSFRKWKKIWSWATSFWSFGNFKKYAIYIFYIYALRGYSGWWNCPTSKKNFSENSLVHMLYIWHSGRIMKPARKWYFWSFLCPKIANFLFFWNYNSNPLTYIFNVARRQIQKKLCRPFKFSLFLGTFGQKWQKMRFSGIKMIKNIIFGLVSWYDHYARFKAYALVNSQKKKFLKLGNFTTHYSPSKRIYKIYILRIFWSCQNFKMKLLNFKFFFIF